MEGAGVKFAEAFIFKVGSVTCLLPHQILDQNSDAQGFQECVYFVCFTFTSFSPDIGYQLILPVLVFCFSDDVGYFISL